MLPLDRPLLDWIALGAAALAVVALVLAVAAHVRVTRMRRGFAALESGAGRRTVFDAVRDTVETTDSLGRDLAGLRGELAAARSDIAAALRHVAVVRYDAFGDMGGRMSFTAALLDDGGDGVLLTSIHGRTESRTYAKGVKAGASEATLSPEEQQAVDLALRRRPSRAR